MIPEEKVINFYYVAQVEERRKLLLKYLEEKVQDKAQSIIEAIKDGKELRSRMLYYNKEPVGAIIFNRHLTANDDQLKIEKGLLIKHLLVFEKGNDDKQNVYRTLLKKAIQKAKENQARTVYYISVSPTDEFCAMAQEYYFEKKVIENLDEKDATITLCTYQMPEKNTKKRQSDYSEEHNHCIHQKKKLKKENTEDEKNCVTRFCTLKQIYINQILSGQKIIEGRPNMGMFKKWKEGDQICFFAGNNQVKVKITKIDQFSSFQEMLEKVGFHNCLPEANSLEQAIEEYQKIPKYIQKAQEAGVLAIYIEKII